MQRDFLKYTAQMIKANVERKDISLLESFRVNAKDRKYPRLTGRAGDMGKKSSGH